jgi:peptide chain release factor 1
MGGINQATLMFVGDDAWSRLRFEGGPHRVQRVPATEAHVRCFWIQQVQLLSNALKK